MKKKVIIIILILIVIIAKYIYIYIYITTEFFFFYMCTIFKSRQFKSRYNKYMISLSIPEFYI